MEGQPIQLPTGKTTLRAIAVAENGKVSYEMSLSFDVEGNLKKMFTSEETFKNLTLYKTTYNTFTKSWGTPTSYGVLPEDQWYSADMESYEAVYDWGTARFCVKKEGSAPVLYALDTTSQNDCAAFDEGWNERRRGMASSAIWDRPRWITRRPSAV